MAQAIEPNFAKLEAATDKSSNRGKAELVFPAMTRDLSQSFWRCGLQDGVSIGGILAPQAKAKMTSYFTDREFAVRPHSIDAIDQRVWGGLHALIQTRLADESFGYRFPDPCADGYGMSGCDRQAFDHVLLAEVPGIELPLLWDSPPDIPVILDLLEFCASAVGQPVQGSYHSYYRHHHLSWKRESGLASFVADVNLLFSRNGIAYELTAEGQARRLLPAPLAQALSATLFCTEDAETNRLLEQGRNRIASPKTEDRQDALEKLWDAFERLKILENGNGKGEQANALLDRAAAPGSKFREMLGEEAKTLTAIGNSFRIRHSETSQEPLTAPEQIDYLFMRMFAFVRQVLKATGRGG